MWCSYDKTTTHNDADCRATPANGLNGNAHFAQVRPPSVPGICSLWDLPVRDDSDEKPCISFLAREVQPAAKPAKARVEEEKRARPFGPVQTAATEGWRTRPWPFTPRAEPPPVTKTAKARVEEKGARSLGPVSTAATEGWRTRPWPFTPRAEQAIPLGGPVAEKTFGMANDEEPVEKALMASPSVANTSRDSASSSFAILMAPAESLPGEVREPLSGEASTPLSGGASPLSEGGVSQETEGLSPVPMPTLRNNRIHRPSVVTRRAAAELTGAVTRYKEVRRNKNNDDDNIINNNHAALAGAESLPGEVREPLSREASTPLSGGASPLSEGGVSQETEGLSPVPMPTLRNNRIHRPSVVTRRAAAELTGAVTRYKEVRRNKNNDDDNIINNNHAALAERFQPSTLHKLRQLGIYTITDTPDDNDINNNNHAALAERFQPSTLHKLRQLGFYAKNVTPDDNNIYNNNHAALMERFQPSTLLKLR